MHYNLLMKVQDVIKQIQIPKSSMTFSYFVHIPFVILSSLLIIHWTLNWTWHNFCVSGSFGYCSSQTVYDLCMIYWFKMGAWCIKGSNQYSDFFLFVICRQVFLTVFIGLHPAPICQGFPIYPFHKIYLLYVILSP